MQPRRSPGRSTGHGLSSTERRDAMGWALAALGRVARSDVLDRVGMRSTAERAVGAVTRAGYRAATTAGRSFAQRGRADQPGVRTAPADDPGLFDLTPTEDQQQLVALVSGLARDLVRPAAPGADDACAPPPGLTAAFDELGLAALGVPEALGGVAERRAAVTGTLVAEVLAHGDMGLAVALLAPGSVATALGLWGSDAQQQTYLTALTGPDAPVASLALTEPTVLFDALEPSTTAVRRGDRLVLTGSKSLVPRGCDAALFVVGARLDDRPVLVLVEASTPGLTVDPDPAMGLRGAGLTRLTLTGVEVPADAVLGETDGTTYTECVRLSRLAWCALAVGTGQAVLDYVGPYVKQRRAFGEPVAHRQAVAFAVADMAIELQAMRLLTYRAAARVDVGTDAAREVGLARKACADHGMRIGLDGVQLLGGHGYVKEHPVERWYRDLRAIGLVEGGVLV